jgi:hypothetical protein
VLPVGVDLDGVTEPRRSSQLEPLDDGAAFAFARIQAQHRDLPRRRLQLGEGGAGGFLTPVIHHEHRKHLGAQAIHDAAYCAIVVSTRNDGTRSERHGSNKTWPVEQTPPGSR